jgi:uncharacterized protein (DUF1330 family)
VTRQRLTHIGHRPLHILLHRLAIIATLENKQLINQGERRENELQGSHRAIAGAAIGGAAIQGLHAQAKPPAYVVVEIDATNPDAFLKEYAPIAGKAITEGGGTYLARGGKNVAIDGEPPKPRTVIVAFDSLEKAQATFTGTAYREGRKIGDKYAKFRIWAMEGIAK